MIDFSEIKNDEFNSDNNSSEMSEDVKLLNIDDKKFLIDFENHSNNDIIKLYNKHNKKVKYGDIYNYLLSKDNTDEKRNWPKSFDNIKDKSILKSKKKDFRKACKKYLIENKR